MRHLTRIGLFLCVFSGLGKSQTAPAPFSVIANDNICSGSTCSFSVLAGSSPGSAGTFDYLTVYNLTSASLQLQATASSSGGWLGASLSPATIAVKDSGVLTLSVNVLALKPGNYVGSVTISGGGASLLLQVLLRVVTASFSVTLNEGDQFCSSASSTGVACLFPVPAGAASNKPDNLSILNLTSAPLLLDVSTISKGGWLRASISPNPIAANQNGNLTISVDAQQLPPNTYTGSVTISVAPQPNAQPLDQPIGDATSGGGTSVTLNVTTQTSGVSLGLSPSPLSLILATRTNQQSQTVQFVDPTTNAGLNGIGAAIQSNQLWLGFPGVTGDSVQITNASSFQIAIDPTNPSFKAAPVPAQATVTVQSDGTGSSFVPAVLKVSATLVGAASTRLLPHFAVGDSFVSDFSVVNSGSSTASFSISFHDDNGMPISLPFTGLGSMPTLSGAIPAGGAAYYEAPGAAGSLLSGSALITSDPTITVQALFRRLGSDGSYYEAAVPAATGSNEIQVPFDDTVFAANGSQIYTGLAVANLDSVNSATISCTARDAAGNPIQAAIQPPVLNPLGHWANYLFPALVGQRGTIDCTSNTQIGAIGIRALGTNALSSLPVITFPMTNPIGAGSIPHFAVGASFVSDFYVVNSGSSAANFSISFQDDSGTPIALPFSGLGNLSTLQGSIPAGGAAYYEAPGTAGALLSGSAFILADPTITVQALFRRLGSDGSYYEAAVPAASGSNQILVPFDDTVFAANGSQIYTGLAVANLDPAISANVKCTASDVSGNVIPNAIPAQLLSPLGHWANYLFPALVGLRGTIACSSNTLIGAIGIRALGTNALSSLPVITP